MMVRTTRIDLQPAFILHTRPFRDTSLLVELLTQDHGLISLVARGVKSKKSRLRGLLQPFRATLASWTGRGAGLGTLTGLEANGMPLLLQGKALLSGLYINEILLKLLSRQDPCEYVYQPYLEVIRALYCGAQLELNLRCFEKKLLNHLGYGLQLSRDIDGEPIKLENDYFFQLEQGFRFVTEKITSENRQFIFSGKSLLALDEEKFYDSTLIKDAKRLMRLAFYPLLNGKELNSRALFE